MTKKKQFYIIHHMEIVEIKNLKNLLISSKYIGWGTTSLCFLLSNGEVLKLYTNSYRKNKLYETRNMYEHLKNLNKLNNESFIGPDKIYIKDGKIIGYSMRYAKGRHLHDIKPKTNIVDLIPLIDKLINDSISLSDYNFKLADLHDKNIIIGDKFSVIDLDSGFFEDKIEPEELIKINVSSLIKTIISAIFKIKDYEIISFNSDELNKLYYIISIEDIHAYKELLIKIREIIEIESLSIKDIRDNKNKLVKVIDVSDYKAHF